MECKAHLRSVIYQLMDYISDLAPEVRVEDENVRYESEHANLAVYPPLSWTEDQCDELQTRIGERITDLNIETGYLILVGVYSPVEQVVEMQQELAATQKKIKFLEDRLSKAASIGLLRTIQTNNELILA
jgi:hypothetical protein